MSELDKLSESVEKRQPRRRRALLALGTLAASISGAVAHNTGPTHERSVAPVVSESKKADARVPHKLGNVLKELPVATGVTPEVVRSDKKATSKQFYTYLEALAKVHGTSPKKDRYDPTGSRLAISLLDLDWASRLAGSQESPDIFKDADEVDRVRDKILENATGKPVSQHSRLARLMATEIGMSQRFLAGEQPSDVAKYFTKNFKRPGELDKASDKIFDQHEASNGFIMNAAKIAGGIRSADLPEDRETIAKLMFAGIAGDQEGLVPGQVTDAPLQSVVAITARGIAVTLPSLLTYTGDQIDQHFQVTRDLMSFPA